MEQVINTRGRFTLLRTEQGFYWCMTTRGGRQWYWHPQERQWTTSPQHCTTEQEATAGIDWTLGHEDAGDLDEQHHQPGR